MYYFLLLFLVIYPFCIFPWGVDPYYTVSKSVYLTCFTFLLWIVYFILLLNGKARTKFTIVEGLILVLLLLVFLSTFFSVDMKLSIGGTEERYEGLNAWISYITLFYMSYRFLNTARREKVYFWVTVSGSFVSIYAILQHFLLDFLPRNSDKLNWTRSYTFFDNPNFFGTYTVITLLLAMTAFLQEKEKIRLNFYYVAICLIFVSMLYSLTRSAWLGSFVGYSILSVYVYKSKFLWKKWLLLAGGLAILFVGVNVTDKSSIMDRAQTILIDGNKVLEGDSHAGSSRFYIWKQSFPLLKNYYLIGSGPDTFGEVFPYDDEELKVYFGTDNIYIDKAHNEFLQIAITLGIPTLIVYIILIILGVFRLAYLPSDKLDDMSENIYRWGLIAIILGYLVQSFFNISVITVAPFYWVILGIVYRFLFEKNYQSLVEVFPTR